LAAMMAIAGDLPDKHSLATALSRPCLGHHHKCHHHNYISYFI